MKPIPTFEDVVRIQKEADEALRRYWADEVFLVSYQWWVILGLTFIPFIVWWKIVDRKRLFEIATYGLLVSTVSVIFDAIGVETDLWEYRYREVPLLDVLMVFDISVMPVVFMIAYQYFNTWKSFAAAHIVLAAVFAFVAEPLLVWMDIYVLMGWKYIYSFPVYLAIAVVLRWLMQRLKKAAA